MVIAKTVGELAAVVKGRVYGDPETLIRGIASIEEAQNGDITFAESSRFLETARNSAASAVLVPTRKPDTSGDDDTRTGVGAPGADGVTQAVIEVLDPRMAFVQLLDLFAPERYAPRTVHPSVVFGSDARIGANPSIGANCVLGENVRLGDNVTLHPLCYLGDDVEVGDNTTIGPNTSLLRGTVVGARVVIHSGAVLGADGFGYVTIAGKHRKVPQIGNVWVGDDVEVGANVTIDRAKTGTTRVGSGTKIDNLVHIGHNCQIGENAIIVAQVGLAGGVEVGNYAVLAGQVGVKEQIKIGAGAVVGAQAGVLGDVAPGAFVSGYGPRPHKEVLKINAAGAQMPDILKKMRAMERRLKQLESLLADALGDTGGESEPEA